MKKKTQRAMWFQRDLDSDWPVKHNKPIFRMKEHSFIDVECGLVLSTCASRASAHNTNYFHFTVVKDIHGSKVPSKVYADKACCGEPNRGFLKMNSMADCIIRKNQINASLAEIEIQRNRQISKIRYKNEQYFGIAHKCHGTVKAWFTTIFNENRVISVELWPLISNGLSLISENGR